MEEPLWPKYDGFAHPFNAETYPATPYAAGRCAIVPTGALIVIIIVVWLFVLAPWLLRSQRPVKHTGEGFDDTRVLFNGDSGTIQGAKRPRLAPADVHRSAYDDAAAYDADDFEVVEAEYAAADASDAAAAGVADNAQAEAATDAVLDGDLVVEVDADDGADVSTDARADVRDDAHSEDYYGDDELLLEDEPAAELEAVADSVEVFTSPVAEPAEESYPWDESFTSPVDVLYPGAVDPVAETDDVEETEGADSAGEGDAQASASAAGAAGTSDDSELSEEEVAFAQRRLGRGGWDPVAEKNARATRYQRRQRTLIGLAVAVVATVALGIVVGGWTWTVAAVVGAATIIYLIALRNQTVAEHDLHRRRVAQLRRARLGVRNAHDEELAIPRNLRRPGAVVLEADDESPDFDFLPVYDGDELDDLVVNRRELRDDLSARRVG